MKRFTALLVITVLFLCSCRQETEIHTSEIPIVDVSKIEAESSTPESEVTSEEISEESEPVVTHSEFYIEDLSVEDVIIYFNEVCLDAEFTDGGNATVIQKWKYPIIYKIKGKPTNEDKAVLADFCEYLNSIKGFSEIREAKSYETPNLTMHFVDEESFLDIMGEHLQGCDGGVTYWYTNDIINEAIIGIRTDIPQITRNAVIIEEIYNGLGATQDTVLRPDSIIFQEFNNVTRLSTVDELILELLYNDEIKVGMNAEECEAVIRELYY